MGRVVQFLLRLSLIASAIVMLALSVRAVHAKPATVLTEAALYSH